MTGVELNFRIMRASMAFVRETMLTPTRVLIHPEHWQLKAEPGVVSVVDDIMGQPVVCCSADIPLELSPLPCFTKE